MDNNYIKVLIEGRRINNYVKWLIQQKIDIINLNIITHNKLELTIYYKDYNILKKYSKTYKVSILKKYGFISIIDNIKKNIYLIIPLFIATMLLYFLSNIIFSVEVVYNNQELVLLIEKELKKYGIEKYRFKKDYTYLEKITKEILETNKNTLEWLEIVENGTKYIVKLVERKTEEPNKNYEYQSIVASKDAIITSIKASSGEKIKDINDYVKKDDVIVSGVLAKPTGELLYQRAKATIYGEVWYKVEIEYPYAYYEEKLTGKYKNIFVLNVLNKKIPIFPYEKYKEFKIKNNNKLLENNILPISLSKEKQYEVIVTEEIYTWEEAISNATQLARKKLLENNSKIIDIKKVDILEKKTIGSKIKLSIFVSVEEDITKVLEIKKIEDYKLKN